MAPPAASATGALLAVVALTVSACLAALTAWRARHRGAPVAGADVAVGVACLLWTAGVTGLALDGLLGSGEGGEPDLTVAILGTGAGGVASAAFVLVRMGWSGAGLEWPGWRAVGAGVLLVPPFLAFSAVWVFALEWAGVAVEPQHLLAMVEGESSALVVAMVLLYGGLGAPLTEELLFRGLVLDALRVRLVGRAWVAIGIQGAAFGLVHGADPAAVVPLTILGVALGWLRLRTGSLWPAIVAHAANNWVALALALSQVGAT